MKKIFTLFLALFSFNAFLFAEDDFTTLQFVDADGNVLENGSTITVKAAEADVFGGIKMPTGLKVVNNTDAKVSCNIAYNIKQLDNGEFEVCFPSSCVTKNEVGEYETNVGDIKASETLGTQSLWMPEAENYGKCVVTMQLLIQKKNAVTGKYTVSAYGPSITVEFEYTETSASLKSIMVDDEKKQAYNILGQPVDDNYKGIVIVGGKKMVRR